MINVELEYQKQALVDYSSLAFHRKKKPSLNYGLIP
jgi:hypothetical protein